MVNAWYIYKSRINIPWKKVNKDLEFNKKGNIYFYTTWLFFLI